MDNVELCMDERKTRVLFAEYGAKNDDAWTPEFSMVRSVFRAMWSLSLTRERVEAVAAAMNGYEKVDLAEELTRLVRAKVLRSRTLNKKRLYEVNY